MRIQVREGKIAKVLHVIGGTATIVLDDYVGAVTIILSGLIPIPLTETILQKSGFDLEEDYFLDGEARYYRKTIGNGRYFLTVLYYEGHDDFILHVDDCDKCTVVGGNIQYVHQLQNLLNIYNIELEVNV